MAISTIFQAVSPYVDNYQEWYLTPQEQAIRGPQGLTSANMQSKLRQPIEDMIMKDVVYGEPFKINNYY
jgi:hypothetical protein